MKKRNFQFCHRNVAWHRYFNLNWGKFPKDRKCASTRDLNVSWIKWSKLMSSVHRAHQARPWAFGSLWIAIAWGLCSWCCAFRITSLLVFAGVWKALLGVIPHDQFQSHYSKNVYFDAPAEMSPSRKKHFLQKFVITVSSASSTQWVESIFEICSFQPDLGHA